MKKIGPLLWHPLVIYSHQVVLTSLLQSQEEVGPPRPLGDATGFALLLHWICVLRWCCYGRAIGKNVGNDKEKNASRCLKVGSPFGLTPRSEHHGSDTAQRWLMQWWLIFIHSYIQLVQLFNAVAQWMVFTCITMKVLLCERKRHTDRGVSGTPSVVLYWGVPHPWSGGTPGCPLSGLKLESSPCRWYPCFHLVGVSPRQGYPHLDLATVHPPAGLGQGNPPPGVDIQTSV